MDHWEINGIRGRGELPASAGKFSGPLVITGSAHCLWDDLAKVSGKPDFMAINFSGLFIRRNIRHWATLHSDDLPYLLGHYQLLYYPTNTENHDFNFFAHIFKPEILTHSNKDAKNNWQFIVKWGSEKIPGSFGSSAMFGTLVALALGYAPIWLAGIPIEGSGCFYDPPSGRNLDYGVYQKAWAAAAEVFDGRVKSFSGFTRELLGGPEN